MFTITVTHTHNVNVVVRLSAKLSEQVDRLLDAFGGQLSTEDQAALNTLLARESARVTKLEALAAQTP